MSENVYPKANEGGETAHVAPNPSFPDMEETVLDYWDKDDTFQKSVERNPSGDHSQNEFVFFDGPPFANGLPHYGHLLTGYAKDVIPRYQTMKGRKVNRVFGCLGPIPSVLLGDCRRSSEDSPLITDHCLTTVHILTRHAVKSPPTATAPSGARFRLGPATTDRERIVGQ